MDGSEAGLSRVPPNAVLGVVAALVVVLAVVTALLTTQRERPELDPGTPEGTVQIFILAFVEGDDDQAVALLDPALGCSAPLRDVYRPSRVSLSVVSSKITGEEGVVVLDVTEYSGGLFDSWSHREDFYLIRADGSWLITGNPWPVYSCK